MSRCGEGHEGFHGVARSHSQAGLSLIEVLVAVAVLAAAMGGITAGMLVSVRASGDNAARSIAVNGLATVTEDLKTATYSPCVTAASLATAVGGTRQLGDGHRVHVRVESVAYWRNSATPPRFAGGACSTAPGPTRDGGAQLIGLTVSVGGTRVNGEVVVRNPGATP